MTNFPGIKLVENQENFNRNVSVIVNNILRGKINAVGTFTVSSGTTSTDVTDHRVTGESYVGFTGLDSSSADTSTFYLSSRDSKNNKFTITHNSIGSDRSYVYTIIG